MPSRRGVLDARDIVSPFTAVRYGGSHLHMFSPSGDRIASTYEDHVLAECEISPHEDNRRLVVVHYLDRSVQVPKVCRHNQDGCSFTVAVTDPAEFPQSQADRFARAYSEAWYGNDAIVFQGDVVRADGKEHRELFLSEVPSASDAFFRDRMNVAEKVSDPDGAKHPEGRSGHRGQTPFPKSQSLAGHGINEPSICGTLTTRPRPPHR